MRKAAAVAAAGLGLVAVHRYAALRKSLTAASPELRTLAVLVTRIPMNALTLPLIRLVMSIKSQPVAGVVLTEHTVRDRATEVLVLTPTGRSVHRPAVLFLHGGGMCAGSAQLEIDPAARVAQATGAVVVLPNYRLAPENPFPAGLDDCMATLRWMVEHADELGIETGRMAVCGTSAGGGLAAALAQRAVDDGIPLRAQALVSPMLDDRTALRYDLDGKGALTWSPRSNRWAWTAYLGREPRLSDAPDYAAASRRRDVTGLPPAWIGVGDLETFYDECVAYAETLNSGGVPCELVTVRGMYHTAEGIARKASSMRHFQASMLDFLRRHLEVAPKSAGGV
jgi:acetyl esterase/lipase